MDKKDSIFIMIQGLPVGRMSVKSDENSALHPIDPFTRRLLVGDPTYTDAIRLNGRVAFLGIVRSQHSSGELKGFDLSRIRHEPEFIDFISAKDLVNGDSLTVHNPTRVFLASNRVSYVGEPIAAVLARSLYSAEDLVDLVEVEYGFTSQSPIVEAEDGPVRMDADTNPALYRLHFHDRIKRDSLSGKESGDGGSAAVAGGDLTSKHSAFDAHTVKSELKIQRQAAAPIETHSVISSYDTTTDSFTVYATVQQPDILRETLASSLGVAPEKISVKKTMLGGAFGAKGALPYPEPLLACILARRNPGLVVRWASTRSEDMIESVQGRDKQCEIELTCDGDSRITGIRAKIQADVGAFETATDGNSTLLTTARLLPGVYRIPRVDIEVLGTHTPKTPSGPIRDAGKAEACYFLEQAIDAMARHLRKDPVEFRARNLIESNEFPYDNGAGFVYDSGNLQSLLEEILKRSGYADLKAWREKTNEKFGRTGGNLANGKVAGIGLCLVIEDNLVPSGAKDSGKGALVVPQEKVRTFPSGAHLCALLVDVETGMVEIERYVVLDDYGPALNVDYADGRIHGGLGREIGAALLEEVRYDDQGEPLNPTLMDYLIPTALTVPNVVSIHSATPSPLTADGSKGLGEIGSMGVVATVVSAVNDALFRVGCGPIYTVPITPEAIWRALNPLRERV